MRWLMIGLLVSMVALLFAVAGVARHIWVHRRKLREEAPAETIAADDETDLESEL